MIKKLMLLSVMFSSVAYSANIIQIKDNTDKGITLSQNNINRIYIENDKIVDFKYPKGHLYLIQQTKGSEDGSLYLTGVAKEPFSVFVATEKGHHFSLVMDGKEGLGKTYALLPETPAIETAKKWERKNTYEQTLTKLMVKVMHGELPDGYGIENKAFSKRIQWSNAVALNPIKVIKGDKLKVEVFDIENKTKKQIQLKESYFSKGTLATSLSSHELKPYGKTKLYIVRGVSNV